MKNGFWIFSIKSEVTPDTKPFMSTDILGFDLFCKEFWKVLSDVLLVCYHKNKNLHGWCYFLLVIDISDQETCGIGYTDQNFHWKRKALGHSHCDIFPKVSDSTYSLYFLWFSKLTRVWFKLQDTLLMLLYPSMKVKLGASIKLVSSFCPKSSVPFSPASCFLIG